MSSHTHFQNLFTTHRFLYIFPSMHVPPTTTFPHSLHVKFAYIYFFSPLDTEVTTYLV